jgi:hypothetical protein
MRSAEPESVSKFKTGAECYLAGRSKALISTWLVAFITLLLSALREIFDESAYSRFLARHEMTSCPISYAAFLREQESIRARRPKCC